MATWVWLAPPPSSTRSSSPASLLAPAPTRMPKEPIYKWNFNICTSHVRYLYQSRPYLYQSPALNHGNVCMVGAASFINSQFFACVSDSACGGVRLINLVFSAPKLTNPRLRVLPETASRVIKKKNTTWEYSSSQIRGYDPPWRGDRTRGLGGGPRALAVYSASPT